MTRLCSHPVLFPEHSYQISVVNLVLRTKQAVSSPSTEGRGCWASQTPTIEESKASHCSPQL